MNKFNMDYAEEMLNAYEGEHDILPVTQDVVDEFLATHKAGKTREVMHSSPVDAESAHVRNTAYGIRSNEKTKAPIKVGKKGASVDNVQFSEELNTNRLAAEAFAPNIEVSPNPEVDITIKNNGGKSFKGLRQYLIALYAGEEFTMSDGIKATMDNSDAKKISRANIWAKKETLGSFRKVIENAAFDNAVDYAEHPKYSKFRYYVATVKYGNILQPIWINVGLLKNGSAFHIYTVEDAKAEAHRRISDDRAGLTKRHQLSASAKDIIPHSAE